MADLKVNYDLLDSTERTLSSLVSEFQNIETDTGSYGSAMGSGDVDGAMGNFAGNWDYHRKQLVGSMQSLGKMVSATKKHFRDTDDKLASSVSHH